ncbi:MAG: hypothetical protein ACSI46_17150 [Gloeotrichia echinulata DVL01]|jgi:hypothetical protein
MMSGKFLESFSSKFAEQLDATLLTPAFVFWAGGIAAGLQRFGWKGISAWLKQQPEPLQIALLIGSFCVIAASAFVVQRFDFPVLRCLEGYWCPCLRPLRPYFIARQAKRSRRIDNDWQKLARIDPAELTREQRDKFVQLDWKQNHLPLTDELMPTRLGNILHAAEQRPLEKYGLDAIICWSRLWFLLPDGVKTDLQTARADLNTAVRFWLWSVLFIVWTIWAWWAILLGIISAIFAYYWAIKVATTYGNLIEAAFDLYRDRLYQSLRWQLPADPNEERRVGRDLTKYLWRGL